MDEDIPVVIVGGSLVGLTASVLLGYHGVPHILVERHSGTAIHPRAAAFHQRTTEIFRSVGMQDAVERAAECEFVQNGAIVSVDTLGGRELACFYRSVNEGVEHLSPATRLFITQIGLEPVLRKRAVELGADHCFSTELTGFVQNDSGVVAKVRAREDGGERQIRARYMIAADGAHSPVRRALGLTMEGRGEFAQCATIYFRAEVHALLRGRNLSVTYVNQPDLLAFFRFAIMEDGGFLAVFATFDGAGRRQPLRDEDLSEEYCAVLVRKALGVSADFAVEIENVQPWTATAATASSFRCQNIFLAGDAAHLMPPTGGFGGNTGVADVHNLVWKLTMVLDGRADPTLLDSYGEERRPIAALTVEQAYRRYVERVDPSLPSNDLAPNVADTAIELGAVYRSCAVVSEGDDRELVEAPERPSGRAGTRLAHVWIEHRGERVSTLDLAGRGLVLIAGPGGAGWVEAAIGIGDLECVQLSDGAVASAVGLAADGALLLRPDGVIAWRCNGDVAHPKVALTKAIRRVLG